MTVSDPAGSPAGSSGKGRGTYEDVRSRLVDLGYLGRPLDRFVLGGTARQGSFLRRHAAVSLRVALIAGPLLGSLFALAVVVVNRPRLSRPLDSLVLASYFTLAFGATVFFLELAAGLGLAALSRWKGRGVAAIQATAARAGLAVSLLVSGYLAVWWRGRDAASAGPLLDLVGFAALVLVNGALLRVSSLASLAALIRVSDLPPIVPRARWYGGGRLTILAGGLLLIGFLLAPASSRPVQRASFERVDVAGRLLVVGWDGIGADHFDERVAMGRSKLWERVSERALLARLTEATGGTVPSRPSFWTGIATGRPGSEHGVEDAAAERVAGLSSPLGGDLPLGAALRVFLPGHRVAVNAGIRRAPTLWEILSEGEGVGAVGWWATWPAQDRGTSLRPFAIVSDRALFGLSQGQSSPHAITPPALARALGAQLKPDLEAIRALVGASFGGVSPLAMARVEQPATIDGYATRVAKELLGDPRIAVLSVYLPGLDILRSGAGGAGSPEIDGAVTEAYADYAETQIVSLAGRLGPGDWVVVVGDAGRAGLSGVDPRTEAAWILIAGPGTVAGRDTFAWSPLDIAPTLLNLRGFPKSREMPGTVHTSFLDPAWRRRLPPREIDSFGENVTPPPTSREEASEEQTLERLRSLGYVK